MCGRIVGQQVGAGHMATREVEALRFAPEPGRRRHRWEELLRLCGCIVGQGQGHGGAGAAAGGAAARVWPHRGLGVGAGAGHIMAPEAETPSTQPSMPKVGEDSTRVHRSALHNHMSRASTQSQPYVHCHKAGRCRCAVCCRAVAALRDCGASPRPGRRCRTTRRTHRQILKASPVGLRPRGSVEPRARRHLVKPGPHLGQTDKSTCLPHATSSTELAAMGATSPYAPSCAHVTPNARGGGWPSYTRARRSVSGLDSAPWRKACSQWSQVTGRASCPQHLPLLPYS